MFSASESRLIYCKVEKSELYPPLGAPALSYNGHHRRTIILTIASFRAAAEATDCGCGPWEKMRRKAELLTSKVYPNTRQMRASFPFLYKFQEGIGEQFSGARLGRGCLIFEDYAYFMLMDVISLVRYIWCNMTELLKNLGCFRNTRYIVFSEEVFASWCNSEMEKEISQELNCFSSVNSTVFVLSKNFIILLNIMFIS